ncbi:ComEC/Rec2 family competence protein [Lignipirellula cremea]|uniref:ComEC family competence protein n=1 Tax=Lignipirellula cremea TaxID=2528010 RepID=A0A518DUX0_9BACT|nr:ComEC/Rec2 family competence protein [Lignipirellula cremea]QDU95641.1 ComEC family competence protein [Lignipirellula cremea]
MADEPRIASSAQLPSRATDESPSPGTARSSAVTKVLPHQPLVFLAGAFAAGMVLDRYTPPGMPCWLGAAAAALVGWAVCRRFDARMPATICLLLAAASAGGMRHHQYWSVYPADELGLVATEEPQRVAVRAIALGSPVLVPAPPFNPLATMQQGDHTRLSLRVTALRHGDVWRPASGLTTLHVDGHLPQVESGDLIEILGMLDRAPPDENPGGFNYQEQLRAQRQLCRLRAKQPASVSVLLEGSWLGPRRLLSRLRDQGRQTFERYLSPTNAPLAAALVLGQREQLEQGRTQQFFLAGVIHVLAISGMHLAMLTSGVWLLGRLGLVSRRTTLLLVILFVVFFALLTEARPPVVRAAVVISAACLASRLGRPALGLNTIAAAALFLLACNPAELFSTGAQLSFLAVATLNLCAPLFRRKPVTDPLDRLIARSRPWPERLARNSCYAVWRGWLAGVCVWLATLPLVMGTFHVAAPAALLLGPLLAPLTAVALFSGFALLLAGWLIPVLSPVFALPCDASLSLMEGLVARAAGLSWGHWWTVGMTWWWTIVFYVVAACLAILYRRSLPLRWQAALLAAWAACGLLLTGAAQLAKDRAGGFDCTVLAMGHGLSVLLESPDGKRVLYDAGRLGQPQPGARAIAGAVYYTGSTHLDAVILSHADADHYNALPDLLQQVTIREVYVSPVMFQQTSPGLLALRQAILDSGAELKEIKAGDMLEFDCGAMLRCLHPTAEGVGGSDNANSVVLNLEYAGRSLLLTGDLEEQGMDRLLQSDPIDCDVTLAPHHGSSGSAPERFATWCRPEWALISGGGGRDLTDSQTGFQAAGAQVLHTAETGAIRIQLLPDQVKVQTWRRNPW